MHKPFINNKSQCGQDMFLYNQFFKDRKQGVFVDIGAYDGISFSNTFFFEKELSWTGICVEPIPEVFEELKKNRTCTCIQGCISEKEEEGVPFLHVNPSGLSQMLSGMVSKYDPRLRAYIEEETRSLERPYQEIKVRTFNINSLLKNKIKHVNFLSLDTEGGELDILKSWNFEKYTVDVITVENNYSNPDINAFLQSQNYEYVTRLQQDEVYKRKGFTR